MGLRVIIYIDDGICVSDDFEKGQEAGFRIKSDLESAGFIVNRKKSIWDPTQKIVFLGFSVSTTDMIYEVPKKKVEKFKVLAEAILKSGKACAKDISRVTGRLVSMQPALGNLVYLTTRCMFAFIAKQSTWFRKSTLDKGAIDELIFWSKNLQARNGFAIKRKVEITRVIFSDASERGFGGFLITKRGQELAKGDFSGSEKGTSSTHRELLAVKYVMESFGEKLAGQTILWYTDNQNVPIILRKGSSKLDLNFLALEIFGYSLKLGLEICPLWIPREENQLADELSKMCDSDSWGIDNETFEYVQANFGRFTYDRFADHVNKRTENFDAKFFCPGVTEVNTFATDWSGHFNWVCPPISQVGRALRHFKVCKATGVLCVPEWRSAYFWPLLIEGNGTVFKSFVKGYLLLDPYFLTFNKSVKTNVFNGFAKFRTLALLIDYRV